MRAVAGSSWGASKKALLTIYRSLIRSVIDYGAIYVHFILCSRVNNVAVLKITKKVVKLYFYLKLLVETK